MYPVTLHPVTLLVCQRYHGSCSVWLVDKPHCFVAYIPSSQIGWSHHTAISFCCTMIPNWMPSSPSHISLLYYDPTLSPPSHISLLWSNIVTAKPHLFVISWSHCELGHHSTASFLLCHNPSGALSILHATSLFVMVSDGHDPGWIVTLLLYHV